MWAGCSWTGVDVLGGTPPTTNKPQDFLTKPAADPYCVAGTVIANYDAVALLGFNLAEPVAPGVSCAYKPANPNADGPPAVTLTGTGIAVSFSKKTATELRIQVQGPNGGKAGAVGAADRWCYKIIPAAGPVFAPYNMFNSACWDGTGTTFNPAVNKVSAVVFLVPGAAAPTPFDYCIGGFNTGSSIADAPPYTSTSVVMGSIGGPGTTDIDFQRVKVAAGGKSYIIQNNNWGNPTGSDQTIQYTGNSFKITSPTGGSPGNGVPASFPSIYIGGNGDTQMGTYTTRSDDGLPKQVSAIGSLKSTFRYNTAGGDYNATYDIWLAAAPPTARYDDGLSGFVMIWLYKPGSRSPIGSVMRSNVTIPGAPGTWDVWVGPRGTAPNPNRPVVSYVAKSTLMGFTNIDLKPFLTDAAAPTTPGGINTSWYLTDVFGGFEIWSGSGTQNLEVQEFTAVVQ
jgi:xyloglucan-specific endo-beta-1,4-glucanase